MREPFAVVIANKERLSVAGSAELLASLLPEHSPNAIMPANWAPDVQGPCRFLFELAGWFDYPNL